MSVDLQPVRAFLDPSHATLLEKAEAFSRDVLVSRKAPENDVDGRAEARTLLKLMGEAGLFEPIQDRDYRGCCLLREELAFHSPLADAVFALQALSATPLLLGGTPLQISLAHEALSGHAMGAFAMTEPEAGSDAHGIACEARRDGDAYVLNGTKTLISNGGLADFYVVFATFDKTRTKSISAFLVDSHAAGLEFVRPLVMSAPHPLGEIAFRGCRISESARIGKEGEGLKLALSTLDSLRATVGAAACGMAARALSEAIQHAQTRRQFGKPLADLQLIQEKIARMAIRLRASRLLVYEAAWEKDHGAARVTLESGMAKAFATENAQTIVDDAVQILGGRGVLKESMVDLLYRSVRALRIYEGTTEIQHLLVAAQLLKPVQVMRGRLRRRRPCRLVPLDSAQEEGRVALRHSLRAASARRLLRFRRRLLGRHHGQSRERRSEHHRSAEGELPSLGRHRRPLSRRAAPVDRPRLQRHRALDPAEDPAQRGPASWSRDPERRRDPLARRAARRGSHRGRGWGREPPADGVGWRGSARKSTRGRTVSSGSARRRRFPAFTFYFKSNDHGLFRVHAYQYETNPNGENPCSTFIVEATDETFRRAGLSETDEEATVAYCETLFREELAGPPADSQPLDLAALPDRGQRALARRFDGSDRRRRAHRSLLRGFRHQARDGGLDRPRRRPVAGRRRFPTL